jgi:hypothetical protein
MMHAIVTDDQRVTRSCLLLFIDRVRFLFVSYRAPSERGVKSITPDTRESERASSEVLLKLLLRCASHVARLPSPSASVSIGVKEKTTLCFAFGCATATPQPVQAMLSLAFVRRWLRGGLPAIWNERDAATNGTTAFSINPRLWSIRGH